MNLEKELEKYTKYLIDKKYIPSGNRENGVIPIEFIIKNYLTSQERKYSDNIIKVINKLHEELKGEFIICGSLGLAINNCLDRDVHDIDVLVFDNNYETPYSKNIAIGSCDFFLDGIKVGVNKLDIDGINIDLFYHAKVKEVKYTTIDFHGLKLKVESPFGAIKAKMEYLKLNNIGSKDKHLQDLEYIAILSGFKLEQQKEEN